MLEYVWMWLYKHDSVYASGRKYVKILNMAKFWIWQGSQYASVTQHSEYSEYARICPDRVLNISWVLNVVGLWIRQNSEYRKVAQGSKYVTIWLNMSK